MLAVLKCNIRDPKPQRLNPKSRVEDLGFGCQNPKLRVKGLGFRCLNPKPQAPLLHQEDKRNAFKITGSGERNQRVGAPVIEGFAVAGILISFFFLACDEFPHCTETRCCDPGISNYGRLLFMAHIMAIPL